MQLDILVIEGGLTSSPHFGSAGTTREKDRLLELLKQKGAKVFTTSIASDAFEMPFTAKSVIIVGHVNQADLETLTQDSRGLNWQLVSNAITSDDLDYEVLAKMQEERRLQITKSGTVLNLISCPHPMLYPFARPTATCSVVLILWAGTPWARVLLVRRKHGPFKGFLAFPGGFIDAFCESLYLCGKREVKEETKLRLDPARLILVAIGSDPETDCRDHVVSACMAYFVEPGREAEIIAACTAGDDAESVEFMPVWKALQTQLAFNHGIFLRQTLQLPGARNPFQLALDAIVQIASSVYRNVRALFADTPPASPACNC